MKIDIETKTFKTTNPATEKVISTYKYSTNETLQTTIKQSHEAFLKWKKKSYKERGVIIKAIGKELQSRKQDLAKLMTNEMGKLLSQSEQEVDLCSQICKFSAENAAEFLKNEERELSNGGKGIITYAPIGVIYGIQPWNYPSYQVVRYAITNLMAGNSVLLKHAINVTGTALFLETIFEAAGLPKNLFKVLIIEHNLSDTVIENKYVRGVTLTGSPKAGKIVGKKSGAELKKSVLELGSNDAYLILDDADIKLAVEKCVRGRIYNNGETCIAAKRFIAVEGIYEKFKTQFVKAMKEITIGDPLNTSSDMGPMARKDLREKLHDQVEKSADKGAKILCGGNIPEGKGYYYPATVLECVSTGQSAYDDELFGPVAALIKAKDADDAMRIANDSRFGLGGGIFSTNEEKAIKMATENFDTGMVFINSFGLAEPSMPFGGVKDSGFGREHGGFGIKEFVNAKSIIVAN